jgi:hypothetical protein
MIVRTILLCWSFLVVIVIAVPVTTQTLIFPTESSPPVTTQRLIIPTETLLPVTTQILTKTDAINPAAMTATTAPWHPEVAIPTGTEPVITPESTYHKSVPEPMPVFHGPRGPLLN